MATLSSEFSSRLNLKTKTVGADRIRKAKENNEDIAVLSMFLPGSAAVEENRRFRCALGIECRLGDWRLATPGISFCLMTNVQIYFLYKRHVSENCYNGKNAGIEHVRMFVK